MRMFVALWPPADAVDELAAAVAGARSLAPDLRWVPPEQWHLTLAFLGEVSQERRDDVAARLGRAARRSPGLRLRFAGAGRFGGRVLFTRVAGDRDPLRHLAASSAAAGRRAGLRTDDRPYRPHLTLARGGGDADLRPLVAALEPHQGTAWDATDLYLMRSLLGQGAGRRPAYEIDQAWPLAGGPVAPDADG
jgi:2'-5' RNA ligase